MFSAASALRNFTEDSPVSFVSVFPGKNTLLYPIALTDVKVLKKKKIDTKPLFHKSLQGVPIDQQSSRRATFEGGSSFCSPLASLVERARFRELNVAADVLPPAVGSLEEAPDAGCEKASIRLGGFGMFCAVLKYSSKLTPTSE